MCLIVSHLIYTQRDTNKTLNLPNQFPPCTERGWTGIGRGAGGYARAFDDGPTFYVSVALVFSVLFVLVSSVCVLSVPFGSYPFRLCCAGDDFHWADDVIPDDVIPDDVIPDVITREGMLSLAPFPSLTLRRAARRTKRREDAVTDAKHIFNVRFSKRIWAVS